MDIACVTNDNQTQITLAGIIDEKGADELKSNFKAIDLASTKKVIIDCRQISHIGSSGIGKILLLYKHLATAGGTLSVINLGTDLFELFKELKLDTLFTISKK
ncbi:MAG: STAS domain-containing protein [Desulfobulbaceae bacterium]|nr:STAS domain-containing protein [Desulfobulbaceae bacterium]HIJ78413.1 STAS domain-containing protein [Deltaproteobacteria bacterium]